MDKNKAPNMSKSELDDSELELLLELVLAYDPFLLLELLLEEKRSMPEDEEELARGVLPPPSPGTGEPLTDA